MIEIGKQPALSENRYVLEVGQFRLNYFVSIMGSDGWAKYKLTDYTKNRDEIVAAIYSSIGCPVKVYDANGVLIDDGKVIISVYAHVNGIVLVSLKGKA